MLGLGTWIQGFLEPPADICSTLALLSDHEVMEVVNGFYFMTSRGCKTSVTEVFWTQTAQHSRRLKD